jgi:4-amino-4-deoxy-L-arabinose transferase-like glycosyltransferase
LHADNILRDIVILCALAALALWAAWIGYQGYGWDDAHYLLAGEQWAESPPYVGQTHWEVRLGFVLPLAMSIRAFGFTESAVVLVSILFYLGLVFGNYTFGSWLVGRLFGFFAALVTAAVPLLAAWGTTPNIAVALAFYLLASFWCFMAAVLTRKRIAISLFFAGLFIGLGWLSHASAVGLGLAFLILFLVGRPLGRRAYIWIVLGGTLVIASEMGFYWTYTGNPFYRLYLDLHHGTITSAGGQGEAARNVVALARGVIPDLKGDAGSAVESAFIVDGEEVSGRPLTVQQEDTLVESAGRASVRGVWHSFSMVAEKAAAHFDPGKIPKQGTVSPVAVSGLIEPYLLLLIEPYYGLLFLLGALAFAYLVVTKQCPRVKVIALLAVFCGMCVMLAGLYFLYLRPLPRYSVYPATMAAIILGFGLASLWSRGRRRITLVIVVAFLATNLIFMEARRGLGLHNERRLVNFAQRYSAPIVTDADTADMLAFFVRTENFRGAAVGCPLPGSVYFYNGERGGGADQMATVGLSVILGTGQKIYEYRAREKILGVLLRAVGLDRDMPSYVVRRLAFPYGVAVAYTVGWVNLCNRPDADDEAVSVSTDGEYR